MKAIITIAICLLAIIGVLASFTAAAEISSKPASTSDDWSGPLNLNVSYNGTWLTQGDSTEGGAGIATYIGWDGGSRAYAHATTFALAIQALSTIDSAELWVRSGCNACTDSLRLLISILDADAGVQITDTASFRLRFSQRATGALDLDTAIVATATSWGLATKVRIPANKLKGVIQNCISRSGYSGSITIFVTALDMTASTLRRATRNFSFGAGADDGDSLWVKYTAPAAPSVSGKRRGMFNNSN